MTARVIQIYSGSTSSNVVSESALFHDANFLVIEAPSLAPNEGYEFAAALMVRVEGMDIIGGLPVTTYYGQWEINIDGEIKDTQTVIEIPEELTKQSLNLQFNIATQTSIALNVYAVGVTKTDRAILEEKLQEILTNVNKISTGVANTEYAELASLLNQISEDIALQTLSTGIGTALAPITAGSSLALPAATGIELFPATLALQTAVSTLSLGLPF